MRRILPLLILGLAVACGIPEAKPCEEPRLWYAPDASGDVYWGCEPPAGWLPGPPDLPETGTFDTDTDTHTGDTGFPVTVPTGTPPTPPTGDTSQTGTGLLDTRDTGPRDTSARDTSDTGTWDTWDTGAWDTWDTGVWDTWDTGWLDTGLYDTGDTGAP